MTLLVAVTLPPWGAAGKIAKLVIACATLGLLVARLTTPWWRPPTRPFTGISVAPRTWLVYTCAAVLVLGVFVVGLVGQDLAPAMMLPGDPARTNARPVGTFRSGSCWRLVVFEAGGTEVTAEYAGGAFGKGPAGRELPVVYDPANPTHVMPAGSFDFARGPGLVSVVTTLAVLTLAALVVAANSRLRLQRAMTALRGRDIAHVDRFASRMSGVCRLTFGDGSVHDFADTAELQTFLRTHRSWPGGVPPAGAVDPSGS